MTRTSTLGVLVVALALIASGSAGVAGAAPTGADAAESASAASPAPFAQDTTTQDDGNETQDDDSETTQAETTQAENATEADENASDDRPENATASVTFEDQPSNGSTVVVNETELSAGGFVVVLNESSAVIGNSSYLESGTHENVTVELDDEIDETEIVVAEPHLDTNENRTFDYNETQAEEIGPANATDGPYVENGVPVGSTAQITIGNETDRRGTTTAALRAAP